MSTPGTSGFNQVPIANCGEAVRPRLPGAAAGAARPQTPGLPSGVIPPG